MGNPRVVINARAAVRSRKRESQSWFQQINWGQNNLEDVARVKIWIRLDAWKIGIQERFERCRNLDVAVLDQHL